MKYSEYPHNVAKLLSMAMDGYGLVDGLTVWYLETQDQRIIILTDQHKNIAAHAGFISRMNGRVWQIKNIQTHGDFRGRQLAAKIYKYVKEIMKKSMQSDIEQSMSSKKLWTRTMPRMGLHAKLFDTETNYIIDQTYPAAYEHALSKIYTSDHTDPEKYRYTWILSHNDHYPEQNILSENSLLMPYTGRWYTFKDEKINVNKTI